MQTNDTLFLRSKEFIIHEDNKLQKANFSAKPKNELSPTSDLIFNRYILMQADNMMTLLQKDQDKKL